jgi:hypothetical protein
MAPVNYARQYPRFWLGYFFFSVVMFAINVIGTIASVPDSVNPGDLIALAFALLSFWPLYGFIRQRRYNPRWLWFVLFVITAFISAGTALACMFMLVSGQAPFPIAIALGVIAVGGPYLFALYQYLFRSAHLWQ